MDEAEYPGIRVSMTTTFDGVVTPLPNMAEVITSTPEVSQFAELLDMFSFPYYDGAIQSNLAAAYGGIFNEDSTCLSNVISTKRILMLTRKAKWISMVMVRYFTTLPHMPMAVMAIWE